MAFFVGAVVGGVIVMHSNYSDHNNYSDHYNHSNHSQYGDAALVSRINSQQSQVNSQQSNIGSFRMQMQSDFDERVRQLKSERGERSGKTRRARSREAEVYSQEREVSRRDDLRRGEGGQVDARQFLRRQEIPRCAV